MADIHYKKTPLESFQPVFAEVAAKADVLLLCGDLTDYGLPEEAELVVKDLASGQDSDPRRAGQPRLRVRPRGRGPRRAAPTADSRCSTASRP